MPLHLEHDVNGTINSIRSSHDLSSLRIPQVSIDSSGFITTKPDGFIPLTDIIKTDNYKIYMEVPGLKMDDVTVYRQNVKTIIKGNKLKPY